MGGAALPCRTAGNPLRCVDGARRCGTDVENTFEPFLELDFHEYKPDFGGRMYLFLVHFKIPVQEELGRLLFHPLDIYGGDVQANRGWRLEVFDDHHNLLPTQCQDWNYGSSATEHTEGLTDVHHLCLKPTASDEDYEVMSRARFLRITLIGNFRQIWFENVNVFFRAIADLQPGTNDTYMLTQAPTPPPAVEPPPLPPALPDPPSAPNAPPCTFYADSEPVGWREASMSLAEPCGLNDVRCCDLAHEVNRDLGYVAFDAFVLSKTGCCTLVSLGNVVANASAQYGYGVVA